ncbi:MAG: alpha-L-rhamnosidase N-terminal domain-containing protein, partial [Oscillospiraceae bacterium]|nr:alpha-L-rhamnosidase N-terminal domain-containing protein [Oscillospiraceae bacterium]
MLKAIELTCEYLKNPVGIGERNPRFAWIIESDLQNVIQETYRIQVAVNESFKDILWDTGVVNSSESIHIRYEGPVLSSSSRYFYRVKITDNHGRESLWSDAAYFETAMLDNSEWKARFISHEKDAGNFSKGYLLRKEFLLDGEIEFARIYSTALGLYELSVNGCRVGKELLAPGWTSYKKRLQYQTYDVTNMLKSGENAIGATIGCGWYKGDLAGWTGKRNIYGDKNALLLQMLVRYKDGREELILSDESWKSIESPIIYSEIYHGETYDARLEQTGWDCPAFDDLNWHPVQVMDYDMSVLVPTDGLPVKRQEIIKPEALIITPKGER